MAAVPMNEPGLISSMVIGTTIETRGFSAGFSVTAWPLRVVTWISWASMASMTPRTRVGAWAAAAGWVVGDWRGRLGGGRLGGGGDTA